MPGRLDTWRDIHALLAAFFLPMALIYVFTGALYLFGLESRPCGKGPPAWVGRANPQSSDSGHAFGRGPERAGAGCGNRAQAQKPSGLYGTLMILHRARGGAAFNVLGAAFAISIPLIYISGIVAYWSVPGRRKRLLIAAAIGIVVTVVAAVVSL